MKFAWDNYKRYAWGKNELRPLTRTGHTGNMFGECQRFARSSKGQKGHLAFIFKDPLTFLFWKGFMHKAALRQTKTEQGDIFFFFLDFH